MDLWGGELHRGSDLHDHDVGLHGAGYDGHARQASADPGRGAPVDLSLIHI